MRSFLSILFIITCLVAPAAAQRYEARLLDKTSNQPVEYANIGITETETGTNSDSAGYFSLVIDEAARQKTLEISMIGYETSHMPVSDFIDRAKGNQPILYLQKNAQNLNEVVVRPMKLKFAELGTNLNCRDNKGSNVPFPFLFEKKKNKGVKDTLTEIGTLMKVKGKKTFIDSVQINVGYCTYENILYRLNIYEEIKGDFTNILKEPIYIRLTKAEVGNLIKVNLSDKNLVVNNDFIVSIEKVKDLGAGEMSICGKLFGPAMYTRVATRHDRFIKLPIVSMGIAAFVTFSEKIK